MSAIVVDAGARLVRRDGSDIQLAPKAFELLLILVGNQPNAVTHEQLHAALWPGVHVSETSLAALVTQLRKALGDTSGDGRVIRTLHRVGYAFIGDAVVAGQRLGERDAGLPIDLARRVDSDVPRRRIGDRPRSRLRGSDRCGLGVAPARPAAVTGGEASLEDLGSKNGTWVDGERIHGAVPLTDGTTFRARIRAVRFELAAHEPPTKTAAP